MHVHAVIFTCCHFHKLSFSHMQAYMIAQHFTCSLCIGMYLCAGECVFQNVYTYQNLHSVLEFCAPDCVLQDVFFRMCAPELVIFHLCNC